MFIKSLKFKNFRRLRGEVEIPLDPAMNVVCGVNGAGKSSVLDAAAHLLSAVPPILQGEGRLGFDAGDTENISVGETSARWRLNLERGGNELSWSSAAFFDVEERGRGAQPKIDWGFLAELRDTKDEPETVLPYVGYVHSSSTRIPTTFAEWQNLTHKRLLAYRGAFDSEAHQFTDLELWFEAEENLENEARIRVRNLGLQLASLRSIRTALTGFLTALGHQKITEIFVVRTHSDDPREPAKGRIAVKKDGDTFFFDQLSDGERRLVLIVTDVARRMALLNPGMEDARLSPGVLLIDEVDLHLHPTWQRRVAGALRAAFPNLQFIVTSHSPQVLASVANTSIVLLEDGKLVPRKAPVSGRDTNSILEDFMDTPARPPEVAARIRALMAAVEPDPESARRQLADLEQALGQDDPDVVRARAMLDFLEG